jgi:hypothetical protein
MICECCGRDPDDCICPVCPTCHEVGNRYCYTEGYLTYTYEQLLGQAKADIAKAKDALSEAEYYLQWLIEKGPET